MARRAELGVTEKGGAKPPLGLVPAELSKQVHKPDPDAAQRWIVRTPNREYIGVTAGAVFEGGKSVVTDLALARRLRSDFGYEVIPDPFVDMPAPEPPGQRPSEPLSMEPTVGTTGKTAIAVGQF